MKKILQKPFRIIGDIDAGCSYTTAEASRLVTASMGVLQGLGNGNGNGQGNGTGSGTGSGVG